MFLEVFGDLLHFVLMIRYIVFMFIIFAVFQSCVKYFPCREWLCLFLIVFQIYL